MKNDLYIFIAIYHINGEIDSLPYITLRPLNDFDDFKQFYKNKCDIYDDVLFYKFSFIDLLSGIERTCEIEN